MAKSTKVILKETQRLLEQIKRDRERTEKKREAENAKEEKRKATQAIKHKVIHQKNLIEKGKMSLAKRVKERELLKAKFLKLDLNYE